MMNNKLLYIHKKGTTKEVFYVGIGKPDRAYQISPSKRSELWNRTVNKHGVIVEIIETDLTWDKACELEIETISKYKRIKDGGTLVNHTDGGEGATGFNHSDEAKAKISKGNKGKPKSAIHISHMTSCFNKGNEPWNKGKCSVQDFTFQLKPVTCNGITYNSVDEAIKELGIGKTTFYRWVKRNKITYN